MTEEKRKGLVGKPGPRNSMIIAPQEKCVLLFLERAMSLMIPWKHTVICLTEKSMKHVSHTFYTPYLRFLIVNKWEGLNRENKSQ